MSFGCQRRVLPFVVVVLGCGGVGVEAPAPTRGVDVAGPAEPAGSSAPTRTDVEATAPAEPTAPSATTTTANASRIQIDFQPHGIATSPGYLPDTGAVFGSRGNGLNYGWSTSAAGNALFVTPPFADLDIKLWTMVEIAEGPSVRWEIELPNGAYEVSLVVGGPRTTMPQRVSAEGQMIVDLTPADYAPWLRAIAHISVSDGRLTLANPTGTAGTRLCYVDIVPSGG